MFWSLVSLLVMALVIRLAYVLIKAFIAWLGRGKPIERAAEGRNVPPDVQKAAAQLEAYHASRKLGKRSKTRPPKLTRAQIKSLRQAELIVRNDFLDHMYFGWYQVAIIFTVASILGLFLEEFWMFVSRGLTESRVGLVWGPFSPMYGVGAVILTWLSFYMRKKSAKWWQIFLLGMLVGGGLEQIAGWGMETFMGAISWNYTNVPGAITKWVCVPFLIFWGILGLFWSKLVTPWLLELIGEPKTTRQVTLVFLLAVYLSVDIFLTLACFNRVGQRNAGIEPANAFEEWIDENFSNEFMSSRFQNMVISNDSIYTQMQQDADSEMKR